MDDELILKSACEIIDSIVDSEVIFDEACSLSKRIKLQTDESSAVENSVEKFLSVTCQDLQRESRDKGVDELPVPSLAKQIVNLSQACSQEGVRLLNQDGLGKFEKILRCLALKTMISGIDGRLFESMVTKHDLPVEIVWNLHKVGALTLDTFLICKLNEDVLYVEKFSKELVSFCQGSAESLSHRQEVLSGLSGYLIKQGFCEEKSAFKRTAVHILDRVLQGILELRLSADEIGSLVLPTDFLGLKENVSKETLRRFCVHAQSFILSYDTDVTVADILRSDVDWRSIQIYGVVRALLRQLFLPLDCEEVAGVLNQSFDQLKINRAITVTFLSVMYESFMETAKFMNGHIRTQLSEGLNNFDTVKVSVSFLLARLGAVGGRGCFPDYSEWFGSTFGEGNNSVAATRPTFTFLIKFLTNMVPSESAEYVKAHIIKKPAIPPKCRDLYDDYVALAKTRLEDLKVPLNDIWEGIYSSPRASKGTQFGKDLNPAQKDVEKALESYAETWKIPTAVIEASLFRKPYFVGKFLPALLKTRHLPDVPDVRMKFIAEMYSSGKIPQSMYSAYSEKCEKEKLAFLEGVFDVDDDSELEEMSLPPLDQVSVRIKKYVEAVSCSSQEKSSECLGQVLERLTSLFGSSSMERSSPADTIFVDLLKPLGDTLPVQIVVEIFAHIRVLINKSKDQSQPMETRARYLRGVKELITGLVREIPELKMTFCSYVLAAVKSEDTSCSLDMSVLATTCACLVTLTDFLDVKHEGHGSLPVWSVYKGFQDAVFKFLDLYRGPSLELGFWLEYVAVALELFDAAQADPQSSLQVQLLPSCVVKRVTLLSRKLKLTNLRQAEKVEELKSRSALADGVLSHPQWQVLCEQYQPTLHEWTQFELSMVLHKKSLLAEEGAADLWEMSQFYLQNSDLPGRLSVSDFCSEVLLILSQNLADTSRDLHSVSEDVSESLLYFIQLLKRHLLNLPSSVAGCPTWLASVLKSSADLPCKDFVLRLATELPPHLLFCNSTEEKISKTHVCSANAVLDHLGNSRQNRGAYLSWNATVFIVKALVLADDGAKSVSEVKSLLLHPFVTISILKHIKDLEDVGLIDKLESEFTAKLFQALQWAQTLVDTGGDCLMAELTDSWYKGAALFVDLHQRHGSFFYVFAYLLELVVAHLVTNRSLLSEELSSTDSIFVEVSTGILRKDCDLLFGLLDVSEPGLCKLRRDLGLSRESETGHLRDYYVLWMAAQVPGHVLLKSSRTNLTLHVVSAYIRVLCYIQDYGTDLPEDMEDNCHSVISPWIKRMVDHTSRDNISQISLTESRVQEMDVLLFQYIREKQRGWL